MKNYSKKFITGWTIGFAFLLVFNLILFLSPILYDALWDWIIGLGNIAILIFVFLWPLLLAGAGLSAFSFIFAVVVDIIVLIIFYSAQKKARLTPGTMRTIQRDIAGALLFSNDGYVLIGKNAKGGVFEDLWVIPGGGIDEGESKEDAVKREILEEVGIDISGATIEPVFRNEKRTTEKTLRDTGERVLVDMTFYDFKVTIDQPAASIPFKLEDDFGYAEWVPIAELGNRTYSPSVESLLKTLKLI